MGDLERFSNVTLSMDQVLSFLSLNGWIPCPPTEFWTEVKMLFKLRHCHLVSLFCYSNYEEEMILIYEYMLNGTLEDHLHKLGTPLSWAQRLNIYIGTARGLDYLHTAKISAFGLSKIGATNKPSTYVKTLVKGTFGYLDPNYFTTGMLTRKFDVFSFGVVLLEVLCRKRLVDGSLDEEQWGLVPWAQESIKEGNLKNIIDSVESSFGRMAHPNIINLLGYFHDKKDNCLLVYEHMQMKNRNLSHVLFDDIAKPLSWERRLIMMIGVARGLAYMHSSKEQVIHGCIKTFNILLDQNINVKLRCFGLAKFHPNIDELDEMKEATRSNMDIGRFLDRGDQLTGRLPCMKVIFDPVMVSHINMKIKHHRVA
ncbi:unnamed protein product [Lactuca virosa]|uniref:Protein kinase domain-containing protein n=1 Tax=Lactuca virosa TaxID=75947 RepID=A0AAU9PH91_9ASTR|nr:unnamed protein product [Lactuca virosa]